ncbi:hypothetical protein NIES4102_03110 [Chondrocystis sp. NIES-4102]|nr:hypothetical protein NIES4102_03110 [Chondrocystis sp. NIES-4102]
MNNNQINLKIEQLNLNWQEYDFGNTVYAIIRDEEFFQITDIYRSCATDKYQIRFQNSGEVYIFQEIEQVNWIEKLFNIISKYNVKFSAKKSSVLHQEN